MIDTTKLRELAQATIKRREAGYECDDPYDTYPEDLFAASTLPEDIIELLDRLESAEREVSAKDELVSNWWLNLSDVFCSAWNEIDFAMQQEAGE